MILCTCHKSIKVTCKLLVKISTLYKIIIFPIDPISLVIQIHFGVHKDSSLVPQNKLTPQVFPKSPGPQILPGLVHPEDLDFLQLLRNPLNAVLHLLVVEESVLNTRWPIFVVVLSDSWRLEWTSLENLSRNPLAWNPFICEELLNYFWGKVVGSVPIDRAGP